MTDEEVFEMIADRHCGSGGLHLLIRAAERASDGGSTWKANLRRLGRIQAMELEIARLRRVSNYIEGKAHDAKDD